MSFRSFSVLPIALFIGIASFLGPHTPRCNGQDSKPNLVEQEVRFEKESQQVQVFLGSEHFTTFDFGNYAKPILYPILGPGQIGMTRNWPMKEGVEGEAHDHPHHKSMWISHEINELDFWAETEGRVETTSVKVNQDKDGFEATSKWLRKSDDQWILSDTTTYRFGGNAESRWIDCTITYSADHGDVTFDDTKEGLFAIRTHPDLRLSARPKHGVTEVFGSAVNSEGVEGKAIWGKQAKWLLYQGPIDDKPMSIAMYDHPSNLRHPTTWHARDYGLVTANPFGLHHFLGKEKGEGAYTIPNGESLTLRYRVEFFSGLTSQEKVQARYQSFCNAND